MNNLFEIPQKKSSEEWVEMLAQTGGFRIEKIVSTGQTSRWYDQQEDEWVCVVEGEAELKFEQGDTVRLRRGEHVMIPRRTKHRVSYTSDPCIWLCVFGDLPPGEGR